jgi:Na+-translocating ferredoxin:NAD+ oxidoreductase RnfG subunit
MTETETKVNGKLRTIEYINTMILTIIAIVSGLLFAKINHVTNNQEITSQELIRLKTVQEINVKSVEALNQRVTTLEFNYLDYIKTWVDQNYIRKPQK